MSWGPGIEPPVDLREQGTGFAGAHAHRGGNVADDATRVGGAQRQRFNLTQGEQPPAGIWIGLAQGDLGRRALMDPALVYAEQHLRQHLKILVTSRKALDIAGETIWLTPSKVLPDWRKPLAALWPLTRPWARLCKREGSSAPRRRHRRN